MYLKWHSLSYYDTIYVKFCQQIFGALNTLEGFNRMIVFPLALQTGESVDDMISTLANVNVYYKYKTVFSGFAAQLSDRMVQKVK